MSPDDDSMHPLAGHDGIDVVEAPLQPAVRIWVNRLFVRLSHVLIPVRCIDKYLLNLDTNQAATVNDLLAALGVSSVHRSS